MVTQEFAEKIQEWRNRIRDGRELDKSEVRAYIEETRRLRAKTTPVAGGSKVRKAKPAADVDGMLNELDNL